MGRGWGLYGREGMEIVRKGWGLYDNELRGLDASHALFKGTVSVKTDRK